MPIRLLLALVAVLIIIFWYIFNSIRAFKKIGLDPSLVTNVSPFLFKEKWGFRICLLFIFITCLIQPISTLPLFFTSLLAFGLALIQILLLFAFNRSATQPIISFWLLLLMGLLAIFNSSFTFSLLLIVTLALLQEYSLNYFYKNRTKLYNFWVERQVLKIQKKHGKAQANFSDEVWFNTLHVAVTEGIARPKIARVAENLYYYLKRPSHISSGLMQVRAKRLLSDYESVQRGVKIIADILDTMPKNMDQSIDRLRWMAHKYNGGQDEHSINRYTSYLLLTYPGTNDAWQKIRERKR